MGEEEIMQETQVEMPKYRCHKEVHALKIAEVTLNWTINGDAMVTPEENGYAPFLVNGEYLRKHDPQVGGYYVVYVDGYKSYSPAQAFETGYALVK